MFIIAWIVTLIIEANKWFVIPDLAQSIIGWLALAEAAVYVIIVIINVITFIQIKRNF